MNARLYDPLLGRFLSPDPYVQLQDYTQGLNRYAYAMNNPLCYVDENGEFLFSFTFNWFKGLFTGKNPWKEGWKAVVNEAKITWGLFQGSPGQILSRFTWELPQTSLGIAWGQVSNWMGQVDKVDYWGGSTVISGHNWNRTSAVTLGSFITGPRSLKADPNNTLFQHEYGHYLQSQSMGWGYMSRVGIPSALSVKKSNHELMDTEQDANRRAFLYFNSHVDGFYQTAEQYAQNKDNKIRVGWDFVKNPLNTGVDYVNTDPKITIPISEYRDWHDEATNALLNNLTLKAKWYDYASWGIPLTGTIGRGLYNHFRK
jgi:hypothetical protein